MNIDLTAFYFTPEEVAEILKVDVRTVRTYIRTGKIKAVRISHKVIRIPRSEVEYLLPKEVN